ncbi:MULTISPECIES: XRE family transcriptional regulator [Niastella]|uniref:LexA family transcriptional regulator n=1 Tax=Niastella soli TaxID=2821487 RepID=A0ABS3YSW0_9BACT|nr:S24 family peptidase [Niastella soli]MBO9201001.1 LexA family transcriptional regulator [Niastella soli]
MQIGDRLKDVRKKKNIKMPAIAKATGISKENLYKWEKGTKPSDFSLYNKLVEYLDKIENSPDYVYEEPQSNNTKQPKLLTPALFTGIHLSHDEEAVPLADGNAVPGTIILNDKPMLVGWRIDAPVIGNVDCVIPVTGDSMEPKFKSGSWIALKKLRFTKILNAGYYYYIIDVNLQGLLRRVQPAAENNSIILMAENGQYPEIIRKIDDVLAIFSVEAVIIK